MARNKKLELLELAKQENAKLQTINNMLAKVDKALTNAIRGSVGDAIEGFMPNEVQLGEKQRYSCWALTLARRELWWQALLSSPLSLSIP